MRENRTYGLEGGGTGTTGSSYPYSAQKLSRREGVKTTQYFEHLRKRPDRATIRDE